MLRAQRDRTLLVLTIQRPEARNALSRELTTELCRAVDEAGRDPELRAIVLTGSGEIFVSGGDLKQFGRLEPDASGAAAVTAFGLELSIIERCDLPVIAAVQGQVLGGGCELLMMCDLVVMERQAAIRFLHAKMGLAPAWGGTTRLCERVGALHANELLLTAKAVTAEEAWRIGLANEVVERGESLAAARRIAARIAACPRAGVTAVKRSLVASHAARRASALAEERAVFSSVWGNEGHLAAMSAFLDRAKRRG
jgi:enoyl-CoA hydratase/carnithine racemase